MSLTDGLPIKGNDSASLRELGRQCRCLALGASNGAVAASLNEIAAGYELLARQAGQIESTEAQNAPKPVGR